MHYYYYYYYYFLNPRKTRVRKNTEIENAGKSKLRTVVQHKAVM